MSWWRDEQAIRVLVAAYLALLVASAVLREGRNLVKGTPIGWILLGAVLGALGTIAWHVACEPCQARAKAWRRQLGSRLIE